MHSVFFRMVSTSRGIVGSSVSSPTSGDEQQATRSIAASSTVAVNLVYELAVFYACFVFSFVNGFVLQGVFKAVFSPVGL